MAGAGELGQEHEKRFGVDHVRVRADSHRAIAKTKIFFDVCCLHFDFSGVSLIFFTFAQCKRTLRIGALDHRKKLSQFFFRFYGDFEKQIVEI